MLPDEIVIKWNIHDVHECVEGLTDEQARAVLQYCKKHHDAEVGISYDTLKDAAETLFWGHLYLKGIPNASSQ